MKQIRLVISIVAALGIASIMSAQVIVKANPQSQTKEMEENDGFLTTHWTQSAPYNQFCPMDPSTSSRSYAGCPAVAMAQIINILKNTNNTRFNDSDDYRHNYAGRRYNIDDDFEEIGFLSFPQLNDYLDNIDDIYAENGTVGSNEAAALIFACGVACQQVYTSEGSGTFSVQQAYDGYLRFGFDNCVFFTEANDEMYAMLNENLEHGIPAHLAVESPDGQTGHNVVVDGRREEGKYHINFGFGGSLDGWYNIPDSDFPYGMSKVEGIILNIIPNSPSRANATQQDGIKIFPNPTHDFITIENTDKTTNVSFFNSLGIEVQSQKISDSNRINISNLSKGMYVVKVTSSQGKNYTTKLIIE